MMTESEGIAYQRGSYLPVGEASIPILDPAFTKSDVVFDAVSVWDGSFFRLDDHLRRFRASCDYVRMTPPCPEDEIRRILAQCVHRAGFSAAIVYMLCARGRYPKKIKLAWPELNYALGKGVLVLGPSEPSIPCNDP